MSDMVDTFRAMREHRRERRQAALVVSERQQRDMEEALEQRLPDSRLTVSTEHHWLVRGPDGRVLIQYWPSASKWQVTATGRIHRGDALAFTRFIRGGRW